MIHKYSAYGCLLLSNKKLSILRKPSKVSSLLENNIYYEEKVYDDKDIPDLCFTKDSASFYRDDIGYFYISDNRIVGSKHPCCNQGIYEKNLINYAIPIALFQAGFLVLHAASIKYLNKTILFAGKSGIGKSTITSLFLNDNCIISEDKSIIFSKGGSSLVLPSQIPLIKLSNKINSAKGLKLSNKIARDISNRSTYDVSDINLNNNINKIDYCIFLEKGNHELKELSFKSAFKYIFDNSIIPIAKNECIETNKMFISSINSFLKSDLMFYLYKRGDKKKFNEKNYKIELESLFKKII